MNLLHSMTRTNRLLFVALLSYCSALLQSCGDWFPGIGYLISPLATAPVLLAALMSVPLGIGCYAAAVMLIYLLQPAEAAIFLCTTGILGLGIGTAFHAFKMKGYLVLTGAAVLFAGIMILLYGLRFPVMGPFVSTSFQLAGIAVVLLFCLLYSWLWVELMLAVRRFVRRKVSR